MSGRLLLIQLLPNSFRFSPRNFFLQCVAFSSQQFHVLCYAHIRVLRKVRLSSKFTRTFTKTFHVSGAFVSCWSKYAGPTARKVLRKLFGVQGSMGSRLRFAFGLSYVEELFQLI